MKTNLRIVLALSTYKSANYVAERLCRTKNVVGIIFERKRTAKEIVLRLIKRAKKRGVIKLIDELLFRVVNWLTQPKNKLLIVDKTFMKNAPQCYVKSVNDTKAIKFIKDLETDVLVVYGTGILNKEIISIPKHGVVNIHPGITPEYRGLEPIFWTIVNKDFDKIGVTIHFIDEGLDTGPILAQATVDINQNDSYHKLFEKLIEKGVDLMIKTLSNMENGTIKTIEKPESISRVYSRPGISNYLAYRRGLRAYLSSKS